MAGNGKIAHKGNRVFTLDIFGKIRITIMRSPEAAREWVRGSGQQHVRFNFLVENYPNQLEAAISEIESK